jgi:nucleoside-diphosphate-sugar epimerase
MKILITGLHGFVGADPVSHLKTGHTLYGLDIVFPEIDTISISPEKSMT